MLNDELQEYSRALDEFAWYNKGSAFDLARMAKHLGRDYMQDLAERKALLLEQERSKNDDY